MTIFTWIRRWMPWIVLAHYAVWLFIVTIIVESLHLDQSALVFTCVGAAGVLASTLHTKKIRQREDIPTLMLLLVGTGLIFVGAWISLPDGENGVKLRSLMIGSFALSPIIVMPIVMLIITAVQSRSSPQNSGNKQRGVLLPLLLILLVVTLFPIISRYIGNDNQD